MAEERIHKCMLMGKWGSSLLHERCFVSDEIEVRDRMGVYYGSAGKRYILADKPIATGGEGAVYTVTTAVNQVAKIYHTANSSIERKISIMVSHPPDAEAVAQMAWPIDILKDSSGIFCGFVMNKLDTTNELRDLYGYPPKEFKAITLRHKLIIAQNICAVIAGVHSAGYIFGDFNPSNIGVNAKTGAVAFFDTDSYHIRDLQTNDVFRCNVCLPGYVAPELIAACKRFRATNPNEKSVYAQMPLPTFTQETDNFALAIHIFRLLMNGFYPFNGIDEKTSVSQASPGLNDIAVERGNYCFKAGLKPMSIATPSLSSLPNAIQDLFQRAFLEGQNSPSRRPSATEWYAALEQYEKNLCQCTQDKDHLYYCGASKCPWCEADKAFEADLAAFSKRSAYSHPVPVPQPGNTTYTHQSSSAATSTTPTVIQPATTWQTPGTFWTVTLLGSAAITGIILYILYSMGAFLYDSSGDLEEFANVIAPYILFFGGIIGTILYNNLIASKYANCYTGTQYTLSLLMSPVGMIASYVLLWILVAAIYVIVVIAIIGAVIGGLSGG